MPPTLVYTHAACLNHQPGPHHPESPERLKTVLQTLRSPEFAALEWRDAPMGTIEQVQLIHSQDFIDEVADIAPNHGYMPLDGGDTVMSPGSWEAVMRCVGAACAGVDAVLNDDARNVFCATRPCGHHAEPSKAMGFCIFNQAAIAAAYAYDVHKLERVAVVDFDVHHGNGTQAAFYDRPELFYASSHQSPLYPGTGKSAETGVSHNILNVPLPPGCDSDLFRSRIEADMLPAVREFRPELIIISAGFDAHRLDPLAALRLDDDDFHWITRELMRIADETCKGHVVSILEGGYSMEGLAGGTRAHVRALMEA
ncbi:histone deacetylase family protein [Paraburkholderia sp. PGU16]|jgi:acetoin utilization deacetylase AcuC-like enzyme|uniref:Acetoin utilization protein n=1 Tax=Paraburkholderia largidicola TaxID=3014751 RepID=A0A7I8BXP3_9BURK|nr:histone deacetylase family protein [Paraburkholderia sp. PGU16]BCF93567.1 acetoin utilization protein [Paraburkholderia sp. PGU16]BEU26745.1 histone deacetylase family protein [Paraburkholderia sp. 22B1P]